MKKHSYWLLPLLLIALAIFNNGCGKCCDPMYFPEKLYFKFAQNGQIITDSNLLSKIRIYYIKNGYEIDDPNDIDNDNKVIYDQKTLASLIDTSGLFVSYFLPEISTKGEQYFYFEFPDGSVDSLYLNAEKVSKNDAIYESCDCTTPIRAIKFDGKIPKQIADTLRYTNYYIFNK